MLHFYFSYGFATLKSSRSLFGTKVLKACTNLFAFFLNFFLVYNVQLSFWDCFRLNRKISRLFINKQTMTSNLAHVGFEYQKKTPHDQCSHSSSYNNLMHFFWRIKFFKNDMLRLKLRVTFEFLAAAFFLQSSPHLSQCAL